MRKFTKKMIGLVCLTTLFASMMTGCGQSSSVAKPADTTTETAVSTDTPDDTSDTEDISNADDTAAYEDVDLGQNEDVPEIEGYQLLWNDEFNGDTLDETKWSRELRDPG